MGRAPAPLPTPALAALVAYGRSCGRPAGDVLADVAGGLVHRWDLAVDPGALPLAGAGAPEPAVLAALAGAGGGSAGSAPDLLGQVHEALLDRGHRRRR